MPIYDIVCRKCGYNGEVLAIGQAAPLTCPACGAEDLQKLMSATSSLTGRGSAQQLPGPGDHTCCGGGPGAAGCSGPGSCCGKS